MAHPANRSRRKPKEQKSIQKASNSTDYNVSVDTNLNPNTKRMKMGPYSLPSLATVNGLIQEEARKELRFPCSTAIYKNMALDSNIASAIALIEAVFSRTTWKIVAPKDASEAEKDRAEMLEYNRLVMDRPWEEYISEILSYLVYGFHTPEKIYAKVDTPDGQIVGWKDFRTISQDTIKEWIFKNSTGELAGLKQDLSRIVNSSWRNVTTTRSDVEIPRKKFILFRHNTKRDDPEGQSPLRGAYIDWKYNSLVEEFETIFATKGLGGVLDLGVDVAFLSKASMDPTGPEAQVVQDMKTQAANFHNGDQAYVMTPIAYSESGKELFYTKILETKPPDTDKIVKRHSHRMLQTFFADILQLGADGGGSFALSENKTPLLMVGIRQHLDNIKRTLNHDLIPQTYELNGWDYDPRTSCRFIYEGVEEADLDTLSKAVQRVMSVEAMDRTEDVEDWIRDTFMDLPPRAEANTEVRETQEMQSRAGEGQGTSGTGSSENLRDSSTSNTENS